jgi:hypothetical protein
MADEGSGSGSEVAQQHTYGTLDYSGDEDGGKTRLILIAMGVVIIILAAGLVYVIMEGSYSGNAIVISRLEANITELKAQLAALQHGSSGATSTITKTAPTTTVVYLEYNKTTILKSQYYQFFGRTGYDVPIGINNTLWSGPLNMSFGPYGIAGYLNISYFTAPSYPVSLKIYSGNGTTQVTTRPLLNGYLIPMSPTGTNLLSFSAIPKKPYNESNNTVYVHITVSFIPSVP